MTIFHNRNLRWISPALTLLLQCGLFLFFFPFFTQKLGLFVRGPLPIIDGIIGTPHFYGAAEKWDHWLAYGSILLGALLFYFAHSPLRRLPPNYTLTLLMLLLLFGLGDWQRRLLLCIGFFLLPWKPIRLLGSHSMPLLESVSIPCALYIVFVSSNLGGILDVPHETDIFQAAKSLLEGKRAYQDFFIPHGIGNAWVGALGIHFLLPAQEELIRFRCAYQLLAPIPWILVYFILREWNYKSTHRAWTAVALTIFCGALAGWNAGYPIGRVTWFSGIKLIGPLLTLLFCSRYLRAPSAWGAAIIGGLVAFSLFFALEHGMTSVAVAGLSFLQHPRKSQYALLSFFPLLFLLFSPFTESASLIPNLWAHLTEFTRKHSFLWGMPLFGGRSEVSNLNLIYVPLLLMSLAIASLNRKLLLPLVALFVQFQISLGRSDGFHFRVSIAMAGLLVVALLLRVRKPDRLLIPSLVLAVALGPSFHDSYSVSRETLPLSAEMKEKIEKVSQLEKIGFLTEQSGYLSRTILHHYVISPQEQRKQIQEWERSGIDYLAIDHTKEFNDLPRYARWPLLSHYVTQNFHYCENLSPELILLSKRTCRNDSVLSGWPHTEDIGFLPASLARAEDLGDFSELEFLVVEMKDSPVRTSPVEVDYHCRNAAMPRVKTRFFAFPGQTEYLLPYSSNLTLKFCNVDYKSAKLIDRSSGKELEAQFRFWKERKKEKPIQTAFFPGFSGTSGGMASN